MFVTFYFEELCTMGSKGKGGKDFVKKKVKLGRKVKSSTESKIKLRTKAIHVPHQSSILSEQSDHNELESANKLVKQLHHYSEHHRVQALIGIKSFLTTITVQPERYISFIFPDMIELIFKDDHETRDTLVSVISSTVQKLKAESFISIMHVLVSYLCSGLTNLNKSIRRDSMLILLVFADKSPALIRPYASKLLSHLMLILHDKTLPLLLNPEKVNGKKVKMSMFQVVLRNIGSVLLSLNQRSAGNNAKYTFDEQFAWDGNWSGSRSPSVLIIRSRMKFHDFSTMSSDMEISVDLEEALFLRLTNVWRDIATDGSIAGQTILNALRQIVNVLSIILQLQHSGIASHHRTAVIALLEFFPFISQESLVAPCGSKLQVQCKMQADLLNIEICELVFSAYVRSSRELMDSHYRIDEDVITLIQEHLIEVLDSVLVTSSIPVPDQSDTTKTEILSKILNFAKFFIRENVTNISNSFISHVVRILENADCSQVIMLHALQSIIDMSVELFNVSISISGEVFESFLLGLRLGLIMLAKIKYRDPSMLMGLISAMRCSLLFGRSAIANGMASEITPSTLFLSEIIVRLFVEREQNDWIWSLEASVRQSFVDLMMVLDPGVLKKHQLLLLDIFFEKCILDSSKRIMFCNLMHICFYLRNEIDYDVLVPFSKIMRSIDSIILGQFNNDTEHLEMLFYPVVRDVADHSRMAFFHGSEKYDSRGGKLTNIVDTIREKLAIAQSSARSNDLHIGCSVLFVLSTNLCKAMECNRILRELIVDILFLYLTERFDPLCDERILSPVLEYISQGNAEFMFEELIRKVKVECLQEFSFSIAQRALVRLRLLLRAIICCLKSQQSVALFHKVMKDWVLEVSTLVISSVCNENERLVICTVVSDLMNCF